MFRNVGLHKDRRHFRIDSDGEINASQFSGLHNEHFWILRHCDRVEIYDTEKAFVLALQGHPIAQRPEIISQMHVAGRLSPTENSFEHHDNPKALSKAGNAADGRRYS